MSDSNLFSLAAQREISYGTAATPVALTLVRLNKENFEHDKLTERSEELRSDRRAGEMVEVGVALKGGWDFDLTVGAQDDFLESALMGAFADVSGVPTLVDGLVKNSYVMEKRFFAGAFLPMRGVMIDGLSLTLASRKIIKGSFDCIGRKGELSAVTIDTASGYTAAPVGEVLSSSAHVANIKKIGGATLAGCKNLTLNLKNGLRGNDEIGRPDIGEVGVGTLTVSGKLEAYFRTTALLEEFIDHASGSLSFETARPPEGATTGAHIGYRFSVPKLRWTKGFPTAPGKDSDVMLGLEFEAEVGTFNGAPAVIAVEKLLQA